MNTQDTSRDLFKQLEHAANYKVDTTKNVTIYAGIQPVTHDTYEITKLYLQRPVSLAKLALSQWFSLAHGLQDWEFLNAGSLGDCKQQMIDKGYVRLPLAALERFNSAADKKESR